MSSLAQELANVAGQAKAPVLAKVTQASGQGALTPVQAPTQLVPVQPGHLAVEDIKALEDQAQVFVEKVKADPSAWQLGNFVFSLGREIMEKTQAQVSLYDREMSSVLKNVALEDSSPVAKNILAVKIELDKVNPTMVAKTEMPLPKKVMGLFTRTVNRLPKGDEILRIIAERRETVSSTIEGIRDHLRNEADQVAFDAAEPSQICDALKGIQSALQEQIYLGQQAAAEIMTDTAKVIGDAAVKGAKMSQSMTVNIEALEEARNTYEQAFDAYTAILKETISIASQSSNVLGVMNERFRARTDALTSRRQEN